jgi:hypothetical protein
MVVSNLALRQYSSEWQMVIVYVAFILPVILGFTLRGRESVWRIGGSAIATSVWFFLITNFTYWVSYDLYEKTTAGLVESYVNGLLFFRNEAVANLFFSGLLFGAYFLAVQFGMMSRPVAATAVANQ